MAKNKGTHYVVSAGFTRSGAPAYLGRDGNWTGQLADARCFDSEDEANRFVAKAEAEEQRVVCDPYAFAVRFDAGEIDPLSARENIRAKGPTVPVRRPD